MIRLRKKEREWKQRIIKILLSEENDALEHTTAVRLPAEPPSEIYDMARAFRIKSALNRSIRDVEKNRQREVDGERET